VSDRQLRKACYVALMLTLGAISLMVTFHLTDWSKRTNLTITGAALELAGITLVAMDFWRPFIATLGVRIRVLGRRRGDPARRFLRRFANFLRLRRVVTVPSGARLPSTTSASATSEATPVIAPSTAELTRTINQLIARVGELERRHEAGVHETRQRIDAMVGDVQDMIRRSKDEYLGYRVVGLVIALGGAVVLASANIVA
jgi:hypothetical protein